MVWHLTSAAIAARQRKRLKHQGRPIPANYWPPQIYLGYAEWLDLFWELSTERPSGLDVGQIPYSAILRASEHLRADEAELFRYCVRRMDRAFLSLGEEEALRPENLEKLGKRKNG
jgi:hypothetical protein